jgi:cell fate regulator YaaT (PSP1 superfamily)
MYKVVGVRFKEAGKIYYFDPTDIELKVGDDVIVETVRGLEYGNVVVPLKEVEDAEIVAPLKKVVRKGTDKDREKVKENIAKAEHAFDVGLKKIGEHNLPMKLIDVEYTFDNSKVIFYFTADGRVDFRELVKDLAAIFRTRIELRQIGVRDEAKMLGGIGPCGRQLCCTTFLGDFDPVSIRMAKDQNLSLNPTKISGICGRLMCCLKFEFSSYEGLKDLFPIVGETVITSIGTGEVLQVNIPERLVKVHITGEGDVELPIENILSFGKRINACKACETCETCDEKSAQEQQEELTEDLHSRGRDQAEQKEGQQPRQE